MLPKRPAGLFNREQAQNPEWQYYIWHLARWNLLQQREVAALLGISHSLFKQLPDALSVWRSGQAEAFAASNFELIQMVHANPNQFEDPSERAQVRNHKLDAVKVLSRIYEKRVEFDLISKEREKDRAALSLSSDEDLMKRAKELFNAT